MVYRRYRRAITLIELLISLAIGATLTMITFRVLLALSLGSRVSAYSDDTLASARWSVDSLSDHLRNAQVCTTSGKGVLNSALASGTATSFSYYHDPANCYTVTYSLSGTNLVRTVVTASGTTAETMMTGVSSITFTYLKVTTPGDYNSTWIPTTLPSAPTTTELPSVCGVKIDATVTRNGMSSRINTTVRIRNVPVR